MYASLGLILLHFNIFYQRSYLLKVPGPFSLKVPQPYLLKVSQPFSLKLPQPFSPQKNVRVDICLRNGEKLIFFLWGKHFSVIKNLNFGIILKEMTM